MADLGQIIPALGLGGAVTWAGTAVVQWIKSRGEREQARATADATLEQHTDKFALELLNAARVEIAAVKAELTDLRPLQTRIAHFEEALDHIAALLASEGADERKVAERRATAFLNRMRRLNEARGTLLNEAQIARSAASLPPDMKASIDKLDDPK